MRSVPTLNIQNYSRLLIQHYFNNLQSGKFDQQIYKINFIYSFNLLIVLNRIDAQYIIWIEIAVTKKRNPNKRWGKHLKSVFHLNLNVFIDFECFLEFLELKVVLGTKKAYRQEVKGLHFDNNCPRMENNEQIECKLFTKKET